MNLLRSVETPFYFGSELHSEKGDINMSGHLSMNPFVKSYDELTRSKKRMENYLAINSALLSHEQRELVCGMVENIQQAINHIPEEFQVERYKRK